jgi:hypothetical protein
MQATFRACVVPGIAGLLFSIFPPSDAKSTGDAGN